MPEPMQQTEFTLPEPETITLSGESIEKLIQTGDGNAALLYLYILKAQGRCTSGDAADALRVSSESITNSMAALARLGLINYNGPAVLPPGTGQSEPRRNSATELTRELGTGTDFSSLVEEVQRSLGKFLSPDELERLFGIYDTLRLPPDVILLLVTHCITESRSRGGGRMPSMRFIEKAAYTWESEAIFTLDRAEEYLKALEERKSARGEIKRVMLHTSDRDLSASEQRYVDSWIAMGFSADEIEEAYDRTVVTTGKPALPYINSIINKWHAANLHTIKEILEKDGRHGKSRATASTGTAGKKFGLPDTDDIQRMERLLKKIKEE